MLSAGIRLIDRYGKSDFFDLCRYLGKIYLYLLIVAVAVSGAVITHMDNRTGGMVKIVIKNKILVPSAFSVCGTQECRYIQVKCVAASLLCIPSQAYGYFL